MSIRQFNETVNGLLDPAFANNYVLMATRVFLFCYAVFIVPKLPERFNFIFTNTWFKLAMIALIAWMATHDASTSIMLAVAYMLTMHFLMQKGIYTAVQTGDITPAFSNLVSGTKNKTVNFLNQAVDTVKDTFRFPTSQSSQSSQQSTTNMPQAVLSSGSQNTSASQVISATPSKVAMNNPSMMDTASSSSGPSARVPDFLANVAAAPWNM